MSAVLMFSALQTFAQSSQPVKTLLYHGKEAKTPLEGVSVTAAGASTTMSDAQGQLTLNFRTLKTGDQIQFRRIDMAGHEVMNTEALEAARIARLTEKDPAASTLQIVMAPRQLLRKLRDGYRSVAAQRYEKQLKASEAEVQRLREANKLAEEEYNERMNQLEEEYEEKLSKLETYIEKFARIDLSDLDADEQKIIDLVQNGEFEEALDLYDKQDLANRLRQSRADQAKLTEASQQIAAAERQKALENQRLRQSIDRQVTLLRMAGGEENLQKVYHIVHETFLADTTNVEARREYASTLKEQGQQDLAKAVLNNGIKIATNNYDRGFMTLDLMDYSWIEMDYETATDYARQADSLLMPLKDSNFKVLTRGLPAVCILYLRNNLQKEDFNECKNVVARVEANWHPDTLSYNSSYTYLDLAASLSEYYSRTGNMQKSIDYMNEALKLGEISYQKFPAKNNLFDSYAEASSIYAMVGEKEEACHAVRRSLALIAEKLDKAQIRSLLASFSYDLYTMADALNMIEAYDLFDSLMVMEKNYQIMASLDKYYPGMYNTYLGCYSLSCVTPLLQSGNIDEAEKLYAEGVSKLSASEDGEELLPQLQPAALAQLRQAQGQYDEANKLYQNAIGIFETRYKETNDEWDADSLCRSLLMLANMQGAQGDKKALKKTLQQAERVAPFEIDKQKIARLKEKFK